MDSHQKQRALNIVTGIIQNMMDPGDINFTIWFEVNNIGTLTIIVDSLKEQTAVEVERRDK